MSGLRLKTICTVIVTTLLAGCGGGSSTPPPGATFTATGGPTIHVSTQAAFPTVRMAPIDFTSTTSGGVTTATVSAGPSGGGNNSIFTLPNPPSAGTTLIGAVATQPGTINVSGSPLQMTSSSLAGAVGLSASDFGVWAIWDQVAASPANAVITYSAYAGGTQLTPVMPTTGCSCLHWQDDRGCRQDHHWWFG